jgi:hypothetical protein
MDAITQEWIDAQRARRYRRTPELRVQSVEGARAFVDHVGFCHFWPIKGIEMPNLFHAIAGRVRSVPNAHNDPDLSRCWSWKDRSLGERWWYYAKLLRRRATMVSLEMLPFFYACSDNYGDLDDYLEEYRDGKMTMEAKQIYEALLQHGPLDTVRLRREARMAAETAKTRFDRALVELQVGLKVLPIGVAEAGAWNYAFTYEIVQRYYPELPQQARGIQRSEARRALVLGWTPREVERTIASLLGDGAVREAQIKGADLPLLLSAAVLGREP